MLKPLRTTCAVGLSARKVEYLVDLAAEVRRRSRTRRPEEMDDEAIIAELVAIRHWAADAEIFLKAFHGCRQIVLLLTTWA